MLAVPQASVLLAGGVRCASISPSVAAAWRCRGYSQRAYPALGANHGGGETLHSSFSCLLQSDSTWLARLWFSELRRSFASVVEDLSLHGGPAPAPGAEWAEHTWMCGVMLGHESVARAVMHGQGEFRGGLAGWRPAPSDSGPEPKHVFFRNVYFAFNFKGDHYSSNQNWF